VWQRAGVLRSEATLDQRTRASCHEKRFDRSTRGSSRLVRISKRSLSQLANDTLPDTFRPWMLVNDPGRQRRFQGPLEYDNGTQRTSTNVSLPD